MMRPFYRLVNTLFEREGIEYNSEEIISPRMQCSITLSPLFYIAFNFWQKTGVQLSTAVDAMLHFQDYLEKVQTIEREGRKFVPTSFFNHHEIIQEVPFQDVKILMFAYYDLYNEEGLSLGVKDLQYIWEYLWEVVRDNQFSDKKSRFQCRFLYDNIDQAKALQEKIDPFHKNAIVKVLLEDQDHVEKYDAGWLDLISVDCTFNEYINYCRNYWKGEESKCPNWEYLYVGKYKIEKIK